MAKWEEMRFDILRDCYIAAQRRLKWAVEMAEKAVKEDA